MPQRNVDPGLVEKMAAHALCDDEIAAIVGISESTLKRRFRGALDRGRAQLGVRLRRAQVKLALKGSVPMLIWLGKQYLGQRDRQEVAATPAPPPIDLSRLSDQDYARLETIWRKVAAEHNGRGDGATP